MGAYLDRLNDQFDTITAGIDEVLNRAADENRDVTEDEAQLVEREQAKAEDLKKSIEHYAGIETQRAKVADVRAKVPATVQRATTRVRENTNPTKVENVIPTAGEYAVALHRALAKGDKAAGELITRATEVMRETQHQTTADNPGLIPRPLVGPIITAVGNERPFIQSITNQALPAGSFDRPHITQHVAVGKQTAEKALTDSRKLLVEKLPVSADTYAGHLNVSLQDIRWTQPAILQILFQDFGHEYAVETDTDAVAQFEESIAAQTAIPVATLDAAGVRTAVFGAAAQIMGTANGAPLPDTLWVAPDVWGTLGSMVTDNGTVIFPSVTPTATAGNPMGLRLVVDPHFTPGTAVVGVARYLEWYEDIEGFLTVMEPDVLGQMVGYAGYGAFLNTKPELFVPITFPAAPEAQTLAAASKSGSSK